MSKTVDYFFSLISPWTYFGDRRMHEIASRHGARVVYKPIKLGKVFPVTGGLPLPKRSPQRQSYRLVELQRWSTRLGLPINLHPKHFPADETKAAGMVIATLADGRDPGDFVHAALAAVWSREMDIADDETLRTLAGECGLDGAALLARAETEEIQAVWDTNSDEAIERGVFGSPFYFVGDEPFWGQDRLDLLDDALARDKG